MPIKTYLHKLKAGRRLSNTELRAIMDILECNKITCDNETYSYYFHAELK